MNGVAINVVNLAQTPGFYYVDIRDGIRGCELSSLIDKLRGPEGIAWEPRCPDWRRVGLTLPFMPPLRPRAKKPDRSKWTDRPNFKRGQESPTQPTPRTRSPLTGDS